GPVRSLRGCPDHGPAAPTAENRPPAAKRAGPGHQPACAQGPHSAGAPSQARRSHPGAGASGSAEAEGRSALLLRIAASRCRASEWQRSGGSREQDPHLLCAPKERHSASCSTPADTAESQHSPQARQFGKCDSWPNRKGSGNKKAAKKATLIEKPELERAMRFELTTPTLARLCSTPELRPHRVRRPPLGAEGE